jgi:transcriptional regulator with XRE-family HTH domain
MTPDQLTATLERQGLSQAELARLLGVDKSQVTCWVQGKVKHIHPAVGAYLELREAGHPKRSEDALWGARLLRFCAKRGLDYKQARRLIGYALRRRQNADRVAGRHQRRLEQLRRARRAPVLMARWRTEHTSNPEKRGAPGKPRPPKRCSICRELEHDRRACPQRKSEEGES